ncbi:hypothetical protein MMC10_000227 [Thelotrema lepadinum]|nr:hypothetical protein [Thelotrema lepadinum]
MEESFWTNANDCVLDELERAGVVQEIERYNYIRWEKKGAATQRDWLASEKRGEFELQKLMFKIKLATITRHVGSLEDYRGMFVKRRAEKALVSCFFGAGVGDAVDVRIGRERVSEKNRKTCECCECEALNLIPQDKFRRNLIKESDLQGIDDYDDFVWDVVWGQWESEVYMQALPLFAHCHGEDELLEIFGQGAEGDPCSAVNELVVPMRIQSYMVKGIFTIYPDFPYNASVDEQERWYNSEPREYRIRFLEKPQADDMMERKGEFLHDKWCDCVGGQRYRNMDGKRLTFKNDTRSKPAYVYFFFLVNLVRFAWRSRESVEQILSFPDLKQPCWGAPREFLSLGNHRTRIEQIGDMTLDASIAHLFLPAGETFNENLVAHAVVSQIISDINRSVMWPEELEDSDDESDFSGEDFA